MALADYSAALAVDPGSCYALYNRGITHDRLGAYAAAVKDFSAALALDPSNADFYHNRGFSLRKLVPPLSSACFAVPLLCLSCAIFTLLTWISENGLLCSVSLGTVLTLLDLKGTLPYLLS